MNGSSGRWRQEYELIVFVQSGIRIIILMGGEEVGACERWSQPCREGWKKNVRNFVHLPFHLHLVVTLGVIFQ